ncbi:AraC family transcriptional regulator, partial [Xanthovirga aplysinae]|uniref:AraC family transcriptional regulator n=1 Tax=Xanthovirga aplysinae TaxID=2529853 RepID=UPI0012BB833F
EMDYQAVEPFRKTFPQVFHLPQRKRSDSVSKEMKSFLDLIIKENQNNNSWSKAMVNRLGEIIFIQTIKDYFRINAKNPNLNNPLNNEAIDKILQLIHQFPERNWSVANLAKEAGMSRTYFSNTFRDLTKFTPMGYVTNWRIIKARELLKNQNYKIGEVAEKVGYSSEAAFNRSFKKHTSFSPAAFRKKEKEQK